MNHERVFCFFICIVWAALTVAYAKHLSLEEVENLEMQCLEAEKPKWTVIHEKAIEECKQHVVKHRGDPESCANHFNDLLPPTTKKMRDSRRLRLDPPLPICVEADEARRHFSVNPK